MQTLHRVRDRLVGDRTSLMNQIRSLLLERGHVVAQGPCQTGRRARRTARRRKSAFWRTSASTS